MTSSNQRKQSKWCCAGWDAIALYIAERLCNRNSLQNSQQRVVIWIVVIAYMTQVAEFANKFLGDERKLAVVDP